MLGNQARAWFKNVGVAYVNVRVSKSLKEELAWAIDKLIRVISNKMLFKTVVPLRN